MPSGGGRTRAASSGAMPWQRATSSGARRRRVDLAAGERVVAAEEPHALVAADHVDLDAGRRRRSARGGPRRRAAGDGDGGPGRGAGAHRAAARDRRSAQPGELAQERLRRDRLGDHLVHEAAPLVRGHALAPPGEEEDPRSTARARLDPLRHLPAVHLRHPEIGDDDVVGARDRTAASASSPLAAVVTAWPPSRSMSESTVSSRVVVVHQEHAHGLVGGRRARRSLRRRDDLEAARVQPQPHRRAPGRRAVSTADRCRRGARRCAQHPARPRAASADDSARSVPSAIRRRTSSGIPTPVSCTSTTTQPDSSPRGPDGQGAAPGHRAHRVLDELDQRVAQLERVALDGRQRPPRPGRPSMTMPRRSASSRQRGAVISSASATTAGDAHRAEGDLGLARDQLLEAPHRHRRLQRHVADHREPPLRGVACASLQEELGVGEDGGERVVEVVGEPAHRLAEGAQVHARLEARGVPRSRRRPRSRAQPRGARARSGPARSSSGPSAARCPGSPRGRRRSARRRAGPRRASRPIHRDILCRTRFEHGRGAARGSRAAPPARDGRWRRRR